MSSRFRVPPLHPMDLPDFVKNSFDDSGYESSLLRNQALKNAAWIIVNSCEALEGDEVAAARDQGFSQLVPVGPLLPPEFLEADHESSNPSTMGITGALWGEDDGCLDWLDKQPPLSVLYVSFGSISSISAAEVESLLDGLDRSEAAFLWVLRKNLVAGISDEAWSSYVDRANNHGRVVRWAPQLKVLRHASVAAFLTHCGWNSTLESICAGIPMICWPCFFEQRLNCKYIVDVWKVGIRIHDRGKVDQADQVDQVDKVDTVDLSGTRVEEVVRSMLRDDLGLETRRRIRELRDGCRKGYNLAKFPEV